MSETKDQTPISIIEASAEGVVPGEKIQGVEQFIDELNPKPSRTETEVIRIILSNYPGIATFDQFAQLWPDLEENPNLIQTFIAKIKHKYRFLRGKISSTNTGAHYRGYYLEAADPALRCALSLTENEYRLLRAFNFTSTLSNNYEIIEALDGQRYDPKRLEDRIHIRFEANRIQLIILRLNRKLHEYNLGHIKVFRDRSGKIKSDISEEFFEVIRLLDQQTTA